MKTSAQIKTKWMAVRPEQIAQGCSQEHIKHVIQDAKDDILNLISMNTWQALAAKTVYHHALTDARRHAAFGTRNDEAVSAIGVLHLLRLIDDVQYQSFQNEIGFLITRDWQRCVIASTGKVH